MNQYFLLIACLQLWSLITPVNPASTWGPLIFIFAVSATKEAWDDYNRFLSDKKANEKEVWVVKQGVKKHVCEIFLNPPFSLWCVFLFFSSNWKQIDLPQLDCCSPYFSIIYFLPKVIVELVASYAKFSFFYPCCDHA